MPFDRPYTSFLLVFDCKYIFLLHGFRDIDTYFAKKIKTSHDPDHAHLDYSL